MNLIEQLGGYEETKKHLDSCWCDDDNKAYLLEKLLEYRRQHNIFEVNDWVWHKETLSRIIEINKNGYAYGESELFDVTTIFLKDTVHATDLEIKAGHRL